MNDPRTVKQNALIHVVLNEVGNALGWRWAGQEVDVEDVKSIFMAAYRKATGQEARLIPGLDGQPVLLNWRTRDMTKQESSEFIEMVYAWMAEREACGDQSTVTAGN